MQQVADYVLERLHAWGVARVFGYPGDGIAGFLAALDRARDTLELVQPRHGEAAALMACAHAKFTGELGVCMATSGPGAIHLLNGLYDAKLDHQSVLAIVGQQRRVSLGAGYQQEVDLTHLFSDVAVYVQQCTTATQARHLLDRAVKSALDRRGVSVLVFPEDVQEEQAEPSPPHEHGATYSSIGWSPPRVVPPRAELERAAKVLNDAEQVAILVGQGASDASELVVEAAQTLGAGVAKALLGRDVLPDDLPFVTGPLGLLGSRPSYEMMEHCDALFMIGSSFPYGEWLPREGAARGVEINIDAALIGQRYPMEVQLVGDAHDTLLELLPLLEPKRDRSWRRKIERDVHAWRRLLEERAMMDASPMNPQRVVRELSRRLPDRSVLTADAGSTTTWWARHLLLRRGMRASLSGTLASMGAGVPYAIAAKMAYPDRPVIAVVGDGAFQMNGLAELLTVKRYWRQWSSPTLVVCVMNNQDLNLVTWEQRAMGAAPRFVDAQLLPDAPYARWAELCGLHGIRCDDGDRVGVAWDEALSADRPVVLEAVVDADVAPLPPHVSREQALNLVRALARGDPERAGVIEQTLRDTFVEFKEALAGVARS